MLTEALDHLVRGIVDHPDDVTVTERRARGRQQGQRRGRGPQAAPLTLEVTVHPDDMGRVIGKGGRTATSLRVVLGALAPKRRVRIDFLDVDER